MQIKSEGLTFGRGKDSKKITKKEITGLADIVRNATDKIETMFSFINLLRYSLY